MVDGVTRAPPVCCEQALVPADRYPPYALMLCLHLLQALLAREDQAGGRKRVGAPILTVFSSSIKLVGKLRVRLSTLPANTPLNLSMPLQGEGEGVGSRVEG